MGKKEIGWNIKMIRESRRISREHLADFLNITVSAVGKIERGEVNLSVNKLEQIANCLNVTIFQILNFKPPSPRMTFDLPSRFISVSSVFVPNLR